MEHLWVVAQWLHVAHIKYGSFQCSAAVLSQQYHMNTESGTTNVFFYVIFSNFSLSDHLM